MFPTRASTRALRCSLPSAVRPLVAAYPSVVRFMVHWGDMDVFKHVNNVSYVRYAETARLDYSGRLGEFCPEPDALRDFTLATGIGPILRDFTCRFRAPVTYPDEITAGTRLKAFGQDRMTLESVLVSDRQQRVVFEIEHTVVMLDYRCNGKVSVPRWIMDASRRMVDDPDDASERTPGVL